jgi:uncharacterized protein YjbI with pentapeptide repeats
MTDTFVAQPCRIAWKKRGKVTSMADPEHLEILKRGTTIWNRWREENPTIHPNLGGADISRVDLSGANLLGAHLRRATLRRALLREANLRWADLHEANLHEARLRKADLSAAYLGGADLSEAHMRDVNLSEAHLSGADLNGADLRRACLRDAHLSGAHLSRTQLGEADLSGADLRKANLRGARFRGANLRKALLREANLLWVHLREADLREAELCGANLRKANLSRANLCKARLDETDLGGADLREADLSEANLSQARLVETNLEKANLTGCTIYGISAWGIQLQGAHQTNLRITPDNEPAITVDSLEVAQFIYLHLYNERIRDIIETIGKRIVLILGQFTEKQKPVLEAIREELRKGNYVPMLFDVQTPLRPDSLETIAELAHLARFTLADMTEASTILEDIPHVVRQMAVPVQPLQLEGSGHGPFAPYNFERDDALLETYWYKDLDDLCRSFETKVIAPAEAKARALLAVRLQ